MYLSYQSTCMLLSDFLRCEKSIFSQKKLYMELALQLHFSSKLGIMTSQSLEYTVCTMYSLVSTTLLHLASSKVLHLYQIIRRLSCSILTEKNTYNLVRREQNRASPQSTLYIGRAGSRWPVDFFHTCKIVHFFIFSYFLYIFEIF